MGLGMATREPVGFGKGGGGDVHLFLIWDMLWR